MTEVLIIDGYRVAIEHPNAASENQYVVYNLGNGGMIASDKDREKAIEQWRRGNRISEAVYKLLLFKKTGVWFKDVAEISYRLN